MEKIDYVRVTKILEPYSGLMGIDPLILKNAGERGTKVHHAINGILKGFGKGDLDFDQEGYIESFLKWDKYPLSNINERYYDDELMLKGEVDAIIEIDGVKGILDFKTSSKPSKTWPLQLSAYSYLAFKRATPLFILHLKKDGSMPDFLEYEYDFETFLKCYELYKHFNQEKFNEPKRKTRRRDIENEYDPKSCLDACI